MFGPNVEKLFSNADHLGLGKLLHHKDGNIRKASAQALIRLLKKASSSSSDDSKLIVQQFKSVNDKDVISVLMNEIEKLPIYTGGLYESSLIMAVLFAGGVNELIEFNKRIAKWDFRPDGSYRLNILNAEISRSLIGYSGAKMFGIKELLEIIPYAVCNCEDDGLFLQNHMKNCEEIRLAKEDINRIKELIEHLPPQYMGLSNFSKDVLGKLLLSKLKVVE